MDLKKLTFDSRVPKDCLEITDLLSLFARNAFVLDKERVASLIGFILAIKEQGSVNPVERDFRRIKLEAWGNEARKYSMYANPPFVRWNNCEYRYGDDGHRLLVCRALEVAFEQNENALNALIETEKRESLLSYMAYKEYDLTPFPTRHDYAGALSLIRRMLKARKESRTTRSNILTAARQPK